MEEEKIKIKDMTPEQMKAYRKASYQRNKVNIRKSANKKRASLTKEQKEEVRLKHLECLKKCWAKNSKKYKEIQKRYIEKNREKWNEYQKIKARERTAKKKLENV